ncbi:DNA-directed RNA polymerase II core subunit [Exophiala xenobiotica]|uniref:DNA-directed RNA polymerase II core subunit n=1 Tax=Vermiconidia calcicola TaxID=1690605 RepID=A0AAV9PYP2_9PEZI|nr:DNA-directed RNA polymerase II core subunit [Exophiala xenobiotica]KAK5530422.1 DNA-directed RNA polymerase II core subunit [Vermiconidia calcicola]KAK5531585.1 DNA-directed RNA polymerase II core subunit [Chaetothyriales sp. CCFEE 6169]KAK5392278.1 DNA-directed RNA polymerase II core subunit [Exophiala xenobiotica]KAK5425981.1 DNA-directed RNA polymerase II core subunit [Exophiala xenobiotica]
MSDTVGNSASGGGNDANAAAPRLLQEGLSELPANTADTNLSEREERDDTTVVSTLTVEIKSTDSRPLLTPITEPPTPKPGDTYTGAGPHGLPQDGVGWKNHIARKRYQNPGVDHNAINGQDSTEAFILADGEKKIEEEIDTRTPNTVMFTFNKEDHTLGNLLRAKLLENSHVKFAAYKTDGQITPKEAVIASSKDIINELNALDKNFKKEYDLRKMVGNDGQNGV